MFMTCMDEYIEFCESILPETVVEHRYIKKIGYDDDRYLENGFEHCLQEYSKLFSEDMLSTLLWNRRYKNDSYKEILEKEYGAINISLEDGTYTKIDVKDKKD